MKLLNLRELEWCDNPAEIEVLKASTLDLHSLPEDVTELVNLRELQLFCNSFSTIPEEIYSFTGLQNLDLTYNRLQAIPDSINRLTNLLELYVGGNCIASFPENFGELTKLTSLSLWWNKYLSRLPLSICKLTGLKELDINCNRFGELPPCLGNLTNLTRLITDQNNLGKVPDCLLKLTNLRVLDLRLNDLTEIPQEIMRMTDLTYLDLWANRLTSIPRKVFGLPGCRFNLRGHNFIKIAFTHMLVYRPGIMSLKEIIAEFIVKAGLSYEKEELPRDLIEYLTDTFICNLCKRSAFYRAGSLFTQSWDWEDIAFPHINVLFQDKRIVTDCAYCRDCFPCVKKVCEFICEEEIIHEDGTVCIHMEITQDDAFIF